MSAETRKIITLRVDYDRIMVGQLIVQDGEEADKIIDELQPLIEKHELEVTVTDEQSVADIKEVIASWDKED